MRALFAAILFSLLPAAAIAQERPREPARPDSAPTLPTIGLPLPQIGLPLPQIGLPPPKPRPTRVDRPVNRGDRSPDRRPPRGDGKRGPRPPQVIVYPVPVYGWSQPADSSAAPVAEESVNDTAPPPATAPAPVDRPVGALRLDLQPETDAQLYVDGYFIGTIAEMGTELGLNPGEHSIDVRADGYEPMTVKVKIDADRTITYRGTLQSSNASGAATPAPRAAPKAAAQRGPFYMIPGCYLGNVPPAEAALPKTCDPRRAVTVWP